MFSFQQRAPRLDLSFPVELATGAETLAGRCLNVSESGLLARFDEPLELWTTGLLRLKAGALELAINVRVARVMEMEAGLSFAYRTDAERVAVREVLALASEKTHLTGRPPF